MPLDSAISSRYSIIESDSVTSSPDAEQAEQGAWRFARRYSGGTWASHSRWNYFDEACREVSFYAVDDNSSRRGATAEGPELVRHC
jgi:hypothetical protein